MQRNMGLSQTGLLIGIIFFSLISSCPGDENTSPDEGILVNPADFSTEQYDELITVSDIFPLLSLISGNNITPNISLKLFHAKSGAILSPDTILAVPEVLYITEGAALVSADDTNVTAEKDDAVYIPSQKIRRVVNSGDTDLSFFSIIDWNIADNLSAQINFNNSSNNANMMDSIQVQSERTIPSLPDYVIISDNFTFSRLLHPLKKPYQISYDLGMVELEQGSNIPDHYVDGSFQLMTILSGSGNISVGCSVHEVSPGDMMYISPGALMNITADEKLHMMVITHPFYRSEKDHQIIGACDSI